MKSSVTGTLYRGAALADGTGPDLAREVSMLVDAEGVLRGLWPDGEPPDAADAVEVDASGATIVPGFVDSHNHLTMRGGAHWIEGGKGPREELEAAAEEAGELLTRAGVRWVRDVGSPRRDGRAVSFAVRDRWAERGDRPVVRAAGTWLAKGAHLPPELFLVLDDGDDLEKAAIQQLEEGADLIKLYLDSGKTAAFTIDEVSAVVRSAADRGAHVAAHATWAPGVKVAAEAGVASIEHGLEIDADTAAVMARSGVRLVSTLAVWRSMESFATTTTDPVWTGSTERSAQAAASTRQAREAGVVLAAGTDAGGGSVRHGSSMAWEISCLVEAGVPGWEAVAAATWRGGDLLGDPLAGRLVIDAPARAVFVHGDPYRDPGSLHRVWRVL